MSTVIDVERAVNGRYGQAAQGREPELCCPVEYDPKVLSVLLRAGYRLLLMISRDRQRHD